MTRTLDKDKINAIANTKGLLFLFIGSFLLLPLLVMIIAVIRTVESLNVHIMLLGCMFRIIFCF